jgi:hypothetical protein
MHTMRLFTWRGKKLIFSIETKKHTFWRDGITLLLSEPREIQTETQTQTQVYLTSILLGSMKNAGDRLRLRLKFI